MHHIISPSSTQDPRYTVIETTADVQALPGFWQSIKELEGILNHAIWNSSLFENEKIVSIEKSENGYIVKTTSYCMEFDVDYLMPEDDFVGPAIFNIYLDTNSIEKQEVQKSGGMTRDNLLGYLSKITTHDLYPNPIEKVIVKDDSIILL